MSTSTLPPPYNPAPHLVEGSFLTTPQLISYFQDFYNSLGHLPSTPQYVFERLVGNLVHAFAVALKEERERYGQDHNALDEMKVLRSSSGQARTELPRPESAILTTYARNNPAIGSFHTTEVRSSEQLQQQTSKTVPFTRPYSAPPSIALGLTSLHLPKDVYLRTKAVAKNIHTDGFQLSIEGWWDTGIYSASCAWLEVESNDPDFQCGILDTLEDYPSADGKKPEITRQVTFPRPYLVPPQIVVWINKVSFPNYRDSRLRTYTTNVTTTGFILHIETWGDSIIYNATVSWVACTANKENVYIGSFGTSDLRSSEFSRPQKSGYVQFGNAGRFRTPPRVVMAVNRFDISLSGDMRFSLQASNITSNGMDWSLDGWSDTILYSARASFIALG